MESLFGSQPSARLGAGDSDSLSNFNSMSYWAVTTDQSLPALTPNGLSVMRSTVVPTRRTIGASAELGVCACANGPVAARATVASAAATPTPLSPVRRPRVLIGRNLPFGSRAARPGVP